MVVNPHTDKGIKMKLLFLAVTFTLCLVMNAMAVECPPEMKECKVLFLSADEQKVLTQPNGILATAAQARPLDLGSTVQYFFQKVNNAPEGEVKKVDKPDVKKPETKK